MWLLENALRSDWIEVVIVDNTNLNVSTVSAMHKVAREHGAIFEVDDRFLAVSVRECVARDRERLYPVGESVILDMAKSVEGLKPWVSR